MDELKKLLIEKCKNKLKNDELSITELYDMTVMADIIQSNEKKALSINN